MANVNKELIKRNILKLLDYSGLKDINFADLLEISPRQLKYIKTGEADFSIDSINRSCDFFKCTFSNLNNKEVKLDKLFRDKLILQHKNSIEFRKYLDDNPSISYAIDFELVDNNKFKTKGLEIKEIRKIFRNRGWNYSSTYISLGMKRNQDKITITPHPTKAKTNIYSKK